MKRLFQKTRARIAEIRKRRKRRKVEDELREMRIQELMKRHRCNRKKAEQIMIHGNSELL